MTAVLARDEAAWRELFRRFGPLLAHGVRRAAARAGGRLYHEEVEEILAEVRWSLLQNDLRKLRAWDPRRGARLGTWLGFLAMHAAFDHLRAQSRRPRTQPLEDLPEAPAPEPSALDRLLESESQAWLRDRLATLSAQDRRFVALYYGQGLCPEEVAAAMGIALNTVYSKKHKLQARLARLLRKVPVAGADGPDQRDVAFAGSDEETRLARAA